MSYYRAADVLPALQALATAHPGFAQCIPLPNDSIEGRACTALRFGSADAGGAAKPALLVIGGLHAAERGSCEIAVNLAADLLGAHGAGAGLGYGNVRFSAGDVAQLLQRIDVIVLPLANPDGREFGQVQPGAALWRRNRNPASAGGDPLRVGVDLNRNFDFLFDLAAFAPDAPVVASANPAQTTYFHGAAAFSEPETRNVRWLLDTFPGIRWFVDLHATGPSIEYVWSDDKLQDTDPSMRFDNPAFDGQRGLVNGAYGEFLHGAEQATLQALAERFAEAARGVNGTAYRSGPSFHTAPYSGTSHDWVFARHLRGEGPRVLAFVVEWGELDAQPLWPDMQPIIREVTAGLIGLALAT